MIFPSQFPLIPFISLALSHSVFFCVFCVFPPPFFLLSNRFFCHSVCSWPFHVFLCFFLFFLLSNLFSVICSVFLSPETYSPFFHSFFLLPFLSHPPSLSPSPDNSIPLPRRQGCVPEILLSYVGTATDAESICFHGDGRRNDSET